MSDSIRRCGVLGVKTLCAVIVAAALASVAYADDGSLTVKAKVLADEGKALAASGKTADAIVSFKASIAVEPNRAAYLGLGEAYAKQKKVWEALSALEPLIGATYSVQTRNQARKTLVGLSDQTLQVEVLAPDGENAYFMMDGEIIATQPGKSKALPVAIYG